MAKAARRSVSRKKKIRKNIPEGVVNIYSTFNNTIVTIADPQGNTVAWASAGKRRAEGVTEGHTVCRPKWRRRARRVKRLMPVCARVQVHVKGPGAGRESRSASTPVRRVCGESYPGRHAYPATMAVVRPSVAESKRQGVRAGS